MSDYLDPNNEELLKDFFAEALGQVESLEQNILALEQDTGNKDAVDEIFRAAHTLKGGAATVEMSELAEFTHLVEDVLDGLRSGKAEVNEAVIDALLASIDVIKAMLDARGAGSVYRADITGVKDSLAALLPAGVAKPAARKVAAPAVSATPAPAINAWGSSTVSSVSEYELLELREAAGPSRRIFKLSLTFNPDNVIEADSTVHQHSDWFRLGRRDPGRCRPHARSRRRALRCQGRRSHPHCRPGPHPARGRRQPNRLLRLRRHPPRTRRRVKTVRSS